MAYDEALADRLAHFLLKKVNKTIHGFGMIRDGDSILVALSGGKDSFGLLEILRYRQRFALDKYKIFAAHVVGDARGPALPPYPELEEYLRARGIEYLIRPTYLAKDEQIPMSCERCTWNRRRTLFEMAGELGCNKVAFGHHQDDFAETALLNLIYQGRNETMAPMADYFNGTLHIIRPLMRVPERELVRFASAHDFPSPPPPCPRGRHTQRQRMKELLEEMKKDYRYVKTNIVRAALKNHTQLPKDG